MVLVKINSVFHGMWHFPAGHSPVLQHQYEQCDGDPQTSQDQRSDSVTAETTQQGPCAARSEQKGSVEVSGSIGPVAAVPAGLAERGGPVQVCAAG